MLKSMASLARARSACTRTNKNKFGIDSGSSISSGKIDNKIANLSNFIKKMSFEKDFHTFEASSTFTQLKRVFIKAPILYLLDLERHI